MSRRTFLTGTSVAAAWSALSLGGAQFASAVARDQALATTAARAVKVTGTTLEQVATPIGTGGYKRLTAGPGWPLVVRGDLAAGSTGRDDRRTGLASFVQFSDLHLVDTESPVRFEYLAKFNGSAYRPQEALNARGVSALVERVNSLSGGPYTGMPFSMVMATGDNTDNHELAELDWYLKVMGGGRLAQNTGDPNRYEGVQNSGSATYWNPELAYNDGYKAKGFPQIPGFLAAAGRPFDAPGLRTPWYTTVGNHDDSIEGSLPDLGLLNDLYAGQYKLEGCDDATAAQLMDSLRRDPAGAVLLLAKLIATGDLVRKVTPDERRRPFTLKEFAKAHLNPAVTGAGPYGHGFTSDMANSGKLYYAFRISEKVVGISLDTTNQAGFADGSLGTAQLRWLEEQLQAHSGHWYDADGRKVTGGSADDLVLVFSHHTSGTMGNLLPDPRNIFEGRHDGNELVALLQRYPNVVAWVNGHTHMNKITPHGHAVPERAFWEINTASHIDYPQHGRIIEIADNGDGTLSLFTTLIESSAPYGTDFGSNSDANLAALYRELSYNDPNGRPTALLGAGGDHNTELLIAKPTR
ncbi:TIGR03767 family metallophosphoesterase [Kitasatospora brasiliensis]|uniref:TIGR03767 family metallophosphoesterase n=1 Tax=Kitasatospora brasiliensis TaxID=3058040 RepID=UPI00292CC993|nr:TIGR03767 family metallophosphoesterase [Kitasatospora sp. K002]